MLMPVTSFALAAIAGDWLVAVDEVAQRDRLVGMHGREAGDDAGADGSGGDGRALQQRAARHAAVFGLLHGLLLWSEGCGRSGGELVDVGRRPSGHAPPRRFRRAGCEKVRSGTIAIISLPRFGGES